MKVILLQDVAKIGRRFKVVEVPDGYALNQLIPKRMAEAATPAGLKRVEKMQAGLETDKTAKRERFETAKLALSATVVKIAADVNEQGHAFKAVDAGEIAAAAVAAGIHIEPSMLAIDSPIKEVGEHTVNLVLADQKTHFKIEVTKK